MLSFNKINMVVFLGVLSCFSSVFASQIFIKTLQGKTIIISINSGMTILDIKKAILEKEQNGMFANNPDFQAQDIRLMYSGAKVDNHTKVSEAKIGELSTIHMMMEKTENVQQLEYPEHYRSLIKDKREILGECLNSIDENELEMLIFQTHGLFHYSVPKGFFMEAAAKINNSSLGQIISDEEINDPNFLMAQALFFLENHYNQDISDKISDKNFLKNYLKDLICYKITYFHVCHDNDMAITNERFFTDQEKVNDFFRTLVEKDDLTDTSNILDKFRNAHCAS